MTEAEKPLPEPGQESRAVWMIRAGENGEAEQLCLEHGICGIGWPDLPDLSGMDEEAVEREIDTIYGDQPNGRISNWKMQVRHFMSIADGDIVLMPLKTKKDRVAVGRIAGPYERRTDLSGVTGHVRPAKWLSQETPRQLLSAIKGSLNRPVTISPTPVGAKEIEDLLETGEALQPPPVAGDRRLADPLEGVLRSLRLDEDRSGLEQTVSKVIPATLGEMLGDERPVTHGLGFGRPASVPWVAVHGVESTGSGEEGIYAVYLFATDGSAVYLSVNQGTENVRGGLNPLVKRARDIRTASGLGSPGPPVDLGKKAKRPARYEAASAFAIGYEAGAVPEDDVLLADLNEVLGAVDMAIGRIEELHPEFEPVHLVFKWSADVESQTVDLHRQVAEAKGSVWWGKFGSSESAIAKKQLDTINAQLEAGVDTCAFLFGGGELFRTRLREITTDPEGVDASLLPGYYQKSDCNLFVRLGDFEELPSGWLAEHTVLAKDPLVSADSMSKALGNQTTPLFVYELWSDAEAAPTLTTSHDLTWLASRTYLGKEELDELLEALKERGQIILAGPPGTGKTWIADHLARYLTDDQPLRTKTIQLHPSYGYEEFVEGLRPVADGKGAITFKQVNGVILQMAEEMEGSDETRVLVIDELNRANIPRVFGELLFLLEYRSKTIDLQFSPGFSLPANLKVIATMNTADRSTRSIDVALRRRFEIFECPPRPDILAAYYDDGSHSTGVPGIDIGFAKLNQELSAQLDRHHTIGHSFFMRDLLTPDHLRRTWVRQIRPLLEDYFFDQEDLVDHFKPERYWSDA
jgi:5-methylcytosine-specific restriction protein B